MKINYILSDTTKSATTNALKSLIVEAEKNPFSNYVVIVPETKSIIIEKELLSLSKNGAFLNIFVYSFVRLLKRLDFVETQKIISKQTAVMLIRKIINDNTENLICYKKTAKNINFAEKIYQTIQQFKSSEVSSDDLKLALGSCDESLKAKLLDIILIFEEYEKVLSNQMFDECDKLNLIRDFAKTNEFVKMSNFYITGFDNITFEMVSVLKEIAKNARSITFSTVYFAENRRDKYIQSNDLYFKFKKVADDLKYPYVPKFIASTKKDDFYYISNYLYSNENKQFKSKGNVKIFVSQNREQELRFVANKILELINSGRRFKQIGVMELDLENDEKLIKEIFDEYKINYFINQERNISNHYLLNFIKLCFELYFSHCQSETVLKFLKNKFISNDENLFDFENFVKEYGLNYDDFLKKLDEKFSEKVQNYEKYNEIICNFAKFYINFDKNIKNSQTANDFIKVIKSLFDEFLIEEKLLEISKFQESLNMLEDAQISQVILNKVNEFLDMFSNFFGEEKMSAIEFLQVFLSGFDTMKINLVPASIDAVVVQKNTDGFYDISDLFIVGAQDGMFPAYLNDEGIILDKEIEQTNVLTSKKIEPTTEVIYQREKFIAYESLLEPTENLFVSYSKQDKNGAELKPADIVNKLIKLFGKDILISNYNINKFVSKTNFEREFAKHINKFLNGEYDKEKLNEEYELIGSLMKEKFANYLQNYNKNISFFIDNAENLYFFNNITSASQFEKYFSCPYLYFVNFGLKLKENKDAKLSKLDIGVIIHKVAEEFVKNIKTFKTYDIETFETELDKFLTQIFEKFNLKLDSKNAVVSLVFDEAKRLCKYLLLEQTNSGFQAKYNEFEFKDETQVELNLSDNSKLFLEGKIDRIDEFEDYIRIIDYKTGDISSDLSSIFYGKKIQLISYLEALSKIKDKKIAGLFYLPIHSEYTKSLEKLDEVYKMSGFLLKDIDVVRHMDNTLCFDKPKSDFVPITIKNSKKVRETNTFELSRAGQKFLSEEEFEQLKEYNHKLCETAGYEIKSGYIEPSPIKKGDDLDSLPCSWCEFAGFCGLEKAKNSLGRKCDFDKTIENFSETKEEE